MLAIANALSHDIYYKMIDPNADTKHRLMVAKVILVVVAVLAALLARTKPSDILSMVSWAFSLAAAGLFAPLVLGVWDARTNRTGAVCGMIAGFGLTMTYLIGNVYGFDLAKGSGDELNWFDVKSISSGDLRRSGGLHRHLGGLEDDRRAEPRDAGLRAAPARAAGRLDDRGLGLSLPLRSLARGPGTIFGAPRISACGGRRWTL